jgi:hypothetical protein
VHRFNASVAVTVLTCQGNRFVCFPAAQACRSESKSLSIMRLGWLAASRALARSSRNTRLNEELIEFVLEIVTDCSLRGIGALLQ